MYYIPQLTANDCLFTTFKILLANIKKNEDYLYLPEDERRGPYSFLEIIEKGKEYGVTLFGFECVEKSELKNCENLPVILNIKRENQGLHSVYVYKITKHSIYFLDSSSGKERMSITKFLEIWDGNGLMIQNIEENYPEPKALKFNVKHNLISKLFQTISAFCFVFGIYYIDEVTHVIVPILCIILGIIFEVLTKVTSLKDVRKFDFKCMNLLEGVKNRNYSEYLPRREKLKESLFSAKNNYFFYLLCCAFVIFIILFNNPLNIACIFTPFILALLQTQIISPIERKKENEIELMEVKFSREKNSPFAARTLRKIEEASYKYAYTILGKNAIGIILFFLASFATLFILNAFSLINVFFLMFTEIFLYQNLLPLFLYESRKVEKRVNYMRFINLIQQ